MLHRIVLRGEVSEHADADLLEWFITQRNTAAFEALVRRHGPMVLGVCRRILGNEADAEDAFQATFLVLVKKATSIVPRSLVGHWLYGVAYKTARKARAMSDRRRAVEAGAVRPEATAGVGPEWGEILDDELSRLPERYRIPIVLCELQGHTLRQAAELVGCPQGTLASRLARGRGLLARRLQERGVSLTGSALAAVLSGGAARAAVPAALAASTAKAAALFAAGEAAGAVSATVAALTQGVLKMMLLGKLRSAVALLVLVTLTCSAGALSFSALAGGKPQQVEGVQGPRPLAAARAAAPRALSGREELLALAKRWEDRGRRYAAVTEKETSFEKLREASRRLLPMHDPKEVEAFFDLEKRHRGKDVGLFALNFVVMRAAQVGDPELPLVRGRERALKILGEHYLAHEDLDWPLMSLLGGPTPFGAEDVLKTIAQKSRHEHVRAAALYMWAALLKRNADLITSRRGIPPRAPQTPLDRLLLEQDRKQVERLLKSYDDKQAREQAQRLAKRVLAEYPKTAFPSRMADEEAPMFMPRRIKEPKPPAPWVLKWLAESGQMRVPPKVPTYAERAEALLFELTQLNLGQPAPPVQGRDAFGKEFRLSDYKGKVVVLMFSANWCGPCKQFYPTLRELQKKFTGKPLEIVTVMADSESATVRQAIDKGDITWRALWDGADGPIASKWNVLSFPTLYVLDRRGVIRARDSQDRLADVVAELLKGER